MACTQTMDSVTLQRFYPVAADKLFEAWTNPKWLASWFGPSHMVVVEANLDLKLGGNYSIVLADNVGTKTNHFGQYIDINRPDSLIFTWVLADQACGGSSGQHAQTLVTITFKETKNEGTYGTLLILHHEKLPNQEAIEGHKFGWQASLDALDNWINQG